MKFNMFETGRELAAHFGVSYDGFIKPMRYKEHALYSYVFEIAGYIRDVRRLGASIDLILDDILNGKYDNSSELIRLFAAVKNICVVSGIKYDRDKIDKIDRAIIRYYQSKKGVVLECASPDFRGVYTAHVDISFIRDGKLVAKFSSRY